MARLLVVPWDAASIDVLDTTLGRSLSNQSCDAWCLEADSANTILNDDDVVVHLPTDTTLHRDACKIILNTFYEWPDAVALYSDRIVDGQRQARTAWSPTRIQSEPGTTLPLFLRPNAPGLDLTANPADPWGSSAVWRTPPQPLSYMCQLF